MKRCNNTRVHGTKFVGSLLLLLINKFYACYVPSVKLWPSRKTSWYERFSCKISLSVWSKLTDAVKSDVTSGLKTTSVGSFLLDSTRRKLYFLFPETKCLRQITLPDQWASDWHGINLYIVMPIYVRCYRKWQQAAKENCEKKTQTDISVLRFTCTRVHSSFDLCLNTPTYGWAFFCKWIIIWYKK